MPKASSLQKLTALLLGCVISGLTVLLKDKLPPLVGGMFGTATYFLFLTFLSNLTRFNDPNWFFVIISLITSLIVAGQVHGISVTSSFLMSIGLTYVMKTLDAAAAKKKRMEEREKSAQEKKTKSKNKNNKRKRR
ncbi:hypothetical protein PCE1_003322 [Barthelona sp. PCE]